MAVSPEPSPGPHSQASVNVYWINKYVFLAVFSREEARLALVSYCCRDAVWQMAPQRVTEAHFGTEPEGQQPSPAGSLVAALLEPLPTCYPHKFHGQVVAQPQIKGREADEKKKEHWAQALEPEGFFLNPDCTTQKCMNSVRLFNLPKPHLPNL